MATEEEGEEERSAVETGREEKADWRTSLSRAPRREGRRQRDVKMTGREE